MHNPILTALIYLIAMIIVVPLAKRAGLGAVLGYILAGTLLGPFVLGWIGGESNEMAHLSELGVIMMLFLIGLDLRPTLLWKMRGPIFGLGTLQVTLTSLSFSFVGVFFGLPWQSSLAIGLTLSLSSTAIVLKTLQEKGALKTDGGEASFAVLLFQDLAVIPILAGFGFLALSLTGANQEFGVNVPAWIQALKYLGAVLGVVFAGKWLLRPLFRIVLSAHINELTTAMGLLVVLSATGLMNAVGLSPALGAFLAGVVLAESEYRHQLESDIEPFKALLLGVFFITVGSQINFSVVMAQKWETLGIVFSIVFIKFVILLIVGKIGRLAKPDRLLFAMALAQGGEFAFVLFNQAGLLKLLPNGNSSQLLLASVVVSMALAPLIIGAYFKWVAPTFAAQQQERQPDTIDQERPIIVAGIGRFGQMITRFLRASGFKATVLDFDADQVDLIRKFGLKAFYGDASRLDLLRSAGIENAKLLILAIDDREKTLEAVDVVKQNFPHVKILARAYDRIHAYELIGRGVNDVYIETSGSALELAKDALQFLGARPNRAFQMAQRFKKHNDQSIRALAKVYHQTDEQTFILHAKTWLSALEDTLKADKVSIMEEVDRGWESPPPPKDI